MKREDDQKIIDRALALDCYSKGFHAGADPQRTRRRRTVEPAMLRFEVHYQWGYEDSRRTAELAEQLYRAQLRREVPNDCAPEAA